MNPTKNNKTEFDDSPASVGQLERMLTNYEDISIQNRQSKMIQGDSYIPKAKRGMLDKLSSGVVKNWRTRYFHLEEGIMTYFEPVHWYLKGEYDLFGLEFIEDTNDPPELIRLRNDALTICLRCTDQNSKIRWKAAISDHIEFANAKGQATKLNRLSSVQRLDSEAFLNADDLRFTKTLPESCCGWLQKKGQFIPSIKKRYFVLEAGVLSYYSENVTEMMIESVNASEVSLKARRNSLRRVPKALGKFSVLDYAVISDIEGGRIQIGLHPGPRSKSTRILMLYPEDYVDRDRWVTAINQHSVYNPF